MRSTQRRLRDHRAIEGLLKRLRKLLLGICLDIDAVILFCEALCLGDALLAGPRVILDPSADLTSSIRGSVVAISWLVLPAIEPDASNTIMASSLQGDGIGSSAREAASVHTSRKGTMAESRV